MGTSVSFVLARKIAACLVAASLSLTLVPAFALAEDGHSGVEGSEGAYGSEVPTYPQPPKEPTTQASCTDGTLSGAAEGGEIEGSNKNSLTLASGLVGKPSNFINSDVALDSEPVIGSFTTDGLTYAVIDGPYVELVGIASSNAAGLDDGTLAIPETVSYEGVLHIVSSIAPYAFYLSGVVSATLPASVSDVDERAFRSSDVESVTVAESNPFFSSFDGALYDAEHSSLLLIPEGKQGAVILPKEAETVPPSSFSHCSLVDTVSVEDGSAAFASENGLLYTSDLTTLLRVPAGAAEITIRDGCTTIAAGALEACANLTIINAPVSVTSISPDAFTSIPTVSLPAVTALRNKATEDTTLGSSEQASETSTLTERASQLTAIVALGGGDDVLAVEPYRVEVRVAPGASADAFAARGFSVAGMDGEFAANLPIAEMMSSSTYAATIVSANGGTLFQTRDGGVAVDKGPTSSSETFVGFKINGNYIDKTVESIAFRWWATRTGYSFRGWSKDAAGAQMLATGYAIRSGDSIFAQWTASKCRVTLNSQSATTAGTTSVTATYGSAMPAITKPTKTGYSFGGYYTATNGGGTQYYTAAGASARPWDKTAATTLYAKWTAVTSKVSFNANGGTGGQSAQVTASYGSAMPAISTTKPIYAGYTFGGWYDTSAASGGTQYYTAACASARTWNKTAATTLYARWAKKASHAVTLNKNGGTGGTSTVYYWPDKGYTTSSTSTAVIASGSVLVSSRPTRTGYAFAGYYSAASGGTQYTDASGKRTASAPALSGASTWYAHWTPNSYTVEYWNKAGTARLSLDSGFKYDTARALAAKPSSGVTAGYTAVGWSASANQTSATYGFGSSQKNLVASGTKRLYLAETANTIILTWNSQGGSAVAATSVVYAPTAKVKMPAANPTKAGYTFKGWYTAASGGTKVASTTALPTANTTYHAQWSPISYSIAYELAGGSVSGNPTAYNVETASFTLNNPTKVGYVFTGWSGTGLAGSSNKSVTVPQGSTGSRSYTAHWTPAMTVTVPIQVDVRLDVLGVEAQVPASGYIVSGCGEPLKVSAVAFQTEEGAVDLFGGHMWAVSFVIAAGSSGGELKFPLGVDSIAGPGELGAFVMDSYGAKVPLTYSFDVPDEAYGSMVDQEVNRHICTVSYTVALQNPPA